MKAQALGISDYKKIIEDQYAYVDKTLFIQDVCFSAEVALIPRPRRFGKTTNLSMLYYFFSNREEDHTHLFQNYKIWHQDCLDRLNRPCRSLMGQFPVIFITLKGISQSSWEGAYEQFAICMEEEFKKHSFLLTAIFSDAAPHGKKKGDSILSDIEKKDFISILTRTASKVVLANSLKFLISWLHYYYNKRVIVLIDEYDAPIHTAYLNGYFKPMVDFTRTFFGEGLKDNSLLEKAVITGILRIARENIFSGFNNVTTYTILEETFGDKFGFLEKEVNNLLEEKGLSSQLSLVRNWYNGYNIGGSFLYNPWSITQYIANKNHVLQPYWVNVSSNDLIKKLLWAGSKSLKKDMEKLLLGQSIVKNIQESIIFSDLESQEDVVWSLFFFSGYLTLASKADPNKPKELKIPNKEILELFKQIAQNWLKEYSGNTENLSDMLESLITGEVDIFTELFQKLVLNAMSSHDLPEEEAERVYHAFTLGLLVALEKTHEVKSNRESGFGRYDVCLIPKNPENLGVVLEFKKVRGKESLEQAADLALKQIKEKKYEEELHSRRITRVLALGIAFQGKKILVKEHAPTI